LVPRLSKAIPFMAAMNESLSVLPPVFFNGYPAPAEQ